ncbi:3-deoxy-D-manno-octulosonic acid kinase [Vibrio nigripulchritudo]|uniref:3-deoxy-D-manno-octulosonic acid kinase n=1 Tax=Vibrio nigripulchritudo TaxID=28173 RepID=UPI0005FA54B2|nr:3-deoxy-D-manno-octulosonic acid kinase [Vibrio nigripulchritudo]KJY67294.1 3-deoxy-D-manno-octulosonic acid kinase [Vibrio nigripulchritudo]
MLKSFRSDNQIIWFDDALVEPEHHLFDPEYWKASGKVIGSAKGRGTTLFLDLEGQEAVLRHYYRGGLFGKLIRDDYWFSGWENTRCYQELKVLDELSQAGVRVPKPIAAQAMKKGFLYRADILTEKVKDAKDLVALLVEQPLSSDDYRRIGQEIRKMHDAGVNHTDLNIHNILIDAKSDVWLIDFDKCATQSGTDWQESNLARLLRSFEKEKKKRSILWEQSDWHDLVAGYQLTPSNAAMGNK